MKGGNHLHDCYVTIKNEVVSGKFKGIFQHSNVVDPSPFKGGHPGGVIAYPVAVVEIDNRFKQFNPSEVILIEE